MVLIYTSTIFLSALLLFLVQPMLGKMLLPILGGAPSVWNTMMVCFQALLLGGYLYAYFSQRWLKVRAQALLHLAVLVAAAVALPVIVPSDVPENVTQHPVSWLVTTLMMMVGLPFFVLSANAPMLQSWLASTSCKDAKNPYFLYAASNAGSIIALLGYPFLVEPYFRLSEQNDLWQYGFDLLLAGIAACAWAMRKQHALPQQNSIAEAAEVISPRRRARWLLWAFVPSGMLISTTTIITRDIASAPLLWVIPLAIYLLSFIMVFARKPLFFKHSCNALFPLAMFIAVVHLVENTVSEVGLVFIYLLLLFCVCMVCHHLLARDKPAPKYLTEFYLMMSLGGMLGGIFAALLAPTIFDQVWEYPIMLVLACALCPLERPATGKRYWVRKRYWDVLAPLLILCGMGGIFSLFRILGPAMGEELAVVDQWLKENDPLGIDLTIFSFVSMIMVLLPIIGCFLFRERPLRFSLMVGLVFVVATLQPMNPAFSSLEMERNFFGTVKVREYKTVHYRTLVHGTTLHGIQSTLPELRLTPGSYYHPEGPFGEVFRVLPAGGNVALLGMGTGALACLARKGDVLTYYEINPIVDKFARDERYFTFLKDCPPKVNVKLGDARLEIARAPDHGYDAIVVDVFSSDAVPVHLLTQEAFALYKRKLKPGGLIAVHVSNRHLNLEPVVSAVADSLGLKGLIKSDAVPSKDGLKSATVLVILAENIENIRNFRALNRDWKSLPPPQPEMLWTDDFSNILRVIKH